MAQEQASRKVRVHPGVDSTKVHPLYYPMAIVWNSAPVPYAFSSVYPNKNAGPSSAPPRENNDKDGVVETPETAPEEPSNIAKTADAMEIEESPRDVAILLDEALRNMSILRNKILKAAHHADFSKKCVEAGKVPRGLQIQQQNIHLMSSPDISKTHATLADTIRRSELDIRKILLGHYVTIQEYNDRPCTR